MVICFPIIFDDNNSIGYTFHYCRLTTGINRHGFGKWKEILEDPSLAHKVKQFEFIASLDDCFIVIV